MISCAMSRSERMPHGWSVNDSPASTSVKTRPSTSGPPKKTRGFTPSACIATSSRSSASRPSPSSVASSIAMGMACTRN